MSPDLTHWLGKIANSVTGLIKNDSDMAGVDGDTAVLVMEEYARIERMAAIGKLKAAARVAETGAYRGCGDKDAASYVARRTGCSKRDAQRSLDAANALDGLDATRAAAERGELSEQQLREVADGASVNPDAEKELLAAARREPMAGLREKAQKARASAGDTTSRHERIRRSRRLRHGVDAEGAFWLAYRNTGDVGAAILAAVRPIQDRLFREARDRGERDSYEAYAADAMTELICGSAEVVDAGDTEPEKGDAEGGAGDESSHARPEGGAAEGGTGRGAEPSRRWPPRPNRARPSRDIKVIVRIDHQALTRGHTIAGETCDIAGLGTIPVSTVKEMMGDAFLAAIVTDGVDVRSVAHLGRQATAHQQTALEFTQPDCDVLGCARTMFLQTDHRTGWAKTKDTVYDDLDRLCEHHHALKTHHGWRLEPGHGKRRFLPPNQQHGDTRATGSG